MMSLWMRCSRSSASGITGGLTVPMPPVFAPWSPSPMRLWSCASGSRRVVLAVDERVQRALRPAHEFLDQNPPARVAEPAALHHGVDGLGGLRRGLPR